LRHAAPRGLLKRLRYPADKIEEVRSRADIVEVIGAHVRLRRSGRNFLGLCPFHDEKTPSFTVNAERGFFHCFGCGVGGTVFDFVMRQEGLTFPEALVSLARRFGINLPQPQAGGDGASGQEREKLFAANQAAAEFYGHLLWNAPEGAAARAYLKTRAIAVETGRAFMLGFAPGRANALVETLGRRGLIDAAVKLGLVRKDQRGALYDTFRARLMFPIRDPQGRVIAFGGRVLDERLPKYINSSESPLYSKSRTVYGLHEARAAIAKADRAIIVEGYIDAIALWQAGFKETVAGLGTALTVEQFRLLSRHTKNLIACFDGDAAGRKASMRALEIFLQAGLLGRAAFLPPGFDPDTLIRQRGAEAFKETLDGAELLIDYFLRGQQDAAGGSTEGRARAAAAVADVLSRIADPFEFDLLARKAASMLGVAEEVLRREARKATGTRRPPPAPRPEKSVKPTPLEDAQIGLLALVVHFPQLRAELQERFTALAGGELGEALGEVCRSDQPASVLAPLISNRLSEGIRRRFSEWMVAGLPPDETQARTLSQDYCAALERKLRLQRVAELRTAAANRTGAAAAAAAQELIELRRRQREGASKA